MDPPTELLNFGLPQPLKGILVVQDEFIGNPSISIDRDKLPCQVKHKGRLGRLELPRVPSPDRPRIRSVPHRQGANLGIEPGSQQFDITQTMLLVHTPLLDA
jgi:hypothetical protein